LIEMGNWRDKLLIDGILKIINDSAVEHEIGYQIQILRVLDEHMSFKLLNRNCTRMICIHFLQHTIHKVFPEFWLILAQYLLQAATHHYVNLLHAEITFTLAS